MDVVRLVALALSSFIILPLTVVIYRHYLHPLSRIPGPTLASISNTWQARHVRDGAMLALGKSLHQQYGPVVRVGPNNVWFNSKEAFRVIYSASHGLQKSDFYLATALHKPRLDRDFNIMSHDTLDLLAERDMKRYRTQRRLIGPVYHISNIKKHEAALDEVLEKAIARIKALQGAEVDLKQWMHIIIVECLGAISLSWSPGYLRDGSDNGTGDHSYLGWRRKSIFGLFPWVVVGESYWQWLGWNFSKFWGVSYKAPPGFNPFFPRVSRQTSKRVAAATRPNPPKDTRTDLLTDLIQLHKDKPEFIVPYLRRMATTNFGAGHETTTSAATAVLAMLGSHPTEQKRVADEVRSAAKPSEYDNAVGLAYTQASIKEAQRLYPVIGMSLPRRVSGEGLHLNGYYFPPGTTVGCNPVSLHRNEDIFGPDVHAYRPERWITGANPKEMERYNLTFGGGSRICPGRHLAEFILSKLVSALVQDFDFEVVMPPEEEIRFYFMAMLTGVKIRFLPRTT